MKCGTSSLHEYLGAHPSIFMSMPKEPSFLVDRQRSRRVVCRDEEQYIALFRDADDAQVIGESSTNYSKRPRFEGAPERISAFNAAARIIYIMRDPIERTISHYWHSVRTGAESRDILEAVQGNPHYRAVSHYAMQISPYLERFGSERVYTLTLEQLGGAPAEEMAALYEWLGVDPTFVPESLTRRFHETERVVSRARGGGALARLRRSPAWSRVSPWIPRPIRAVGRRRAEREIDRGSVATSEVAEFLRATQQREVADLTDLLGREFTEWTTLRGAPQGIGCADDGGGSG